MQDQERRRSDEAQVERADRHLSALGDFCVAAPGPRRQRQPARPTPSGKILVQRVVAVGPRVSVVDQSSRAVMTSAAVFRGQVDGAWARHHSDDILQLIQTCDDADQFSSAPERSAHRPPRR
jgi:hypothetical protein